MLGVGISEILVILVVICLVAKPKEIPLYIKNLKNIYCKLMKLKSEFYHAIEGDNYIKGDDGSWYKAYSKEQDDTKKIIK